MEFNSGFKGLTHLVMSCNVEGKLK